MTDPHADRRDAQREKRRRGMQESGRSARLLARLPRVPKLPSHFTAQGYVQPQEDDVQLTRQRRDERAGTTEGRRSLR